MNPGYVSKHVVTVMTLVLAKRAPVVDIAMYQHMFFQGIWNFKLFATQIAHIASDVLMHSFDVALQVCIA